MPEVFFYHLTTSSLEQMLPRILDRTLHNNWRVLLRSCDEAGLRRLDAQLWGGNNSQFLPHGISNGKNDSDQPVLLTVDNANNNGAKALILVHGAKTSVQEIAKFERVSLVFDGNNEMALKDARGDWKQLTEAGVTAKYWSQASGRWEMKAEKN